jgi:flagellar hook-associated protein 1
LVFGDNGDPIPATGGQIGGLINAQTNYITPAVQAIDAVAAGLISSVNTISSQGQGQTGFSSVTGTTQDLDPTAALNSSTAGLAFPPTNGSFDLYMTDATTGQTTTQQINVNLSGQGTQTTLNSLAASISAAGGGTVTGSVNAAGNLVISSSDPNVTFSFGQDTSGTLAGLGINTFFTGSNAGDIGVNTTVQNDPGLLATGQGNVAGSNQNAQALALAGAASAAQLGGESVNDYYQNYIGNLASASSTVSNNSTAQTAVYNALYSQQQSLSGVSMDQETVNLMQYQRAFEGSANFITIVNQMMATVTALITE